MATKLKNLKITKVDFVDEGANPDAHIRMVKRKDVGEQTDPEAGKDGFWKRLLGFVGKAAGMDQEEIDNAVEEIQKGDAVSFGEKIGEIKTRKIADEIWDVCYALQSSLCSILSDDDLDSTGAATAMQESLDEFHALMEESIKKWSNGKAASIVSKSEEVTEAELEIAKSAVERLNEVINKAVGTESEPEDHENIEKSKGDEHDMKIDKSKLTDAEKAFLDSIEKRYGTEEEVETPVEETPETTPTVEKKAPEKEQAPTTEEQDGIYKGLHPAVKAEIESLRKFREEAEERELTAVAGKYEIIGKKKEDLVPLFKSLKAAGGTAYTDMIAVLDQAVETVEKSGAFSEIGKSGHGSNDHSAWTEAETKAAELMKSKTGLTKSQAIDEVLMGDPDLAERCEKED